jgi:queuosine precursor transporter
MSSEYAADRIRLQLKMFHYVAIIFALSFIVSNLLAAKAASLFGVSFSAGTIVFPISYICSDLLTEVYGYKRARALVWFVMLCGLMFAVVCQLAIRLPPAEFWKHQEAFSNILSNSWRISLASNLAYLIGDFTNCRVIAALKLKYQGKFLGLRFISSTAIGTAIDNTLFMVIAFAGIYPSDKLLMMIIAQYIIKLSYETMMIPFSIRICHWLKKQEQIDIFDENTRFTLFSLETSYPASANKYNSVK